MELKSYQAEALQDLKQYLAYLNRYHNYVKAYELLWADKGVRVGAREKMKPYKNVLPHVPHVCFKVPTGGGKTFLACASVKPIFDALTVNNVKAVVWLVPSDAILSQTIRNLKNTDHPYRQRLDRDFGGKVAVYTKEEALNGQGLNPAAVRDQLSLFVLNYDSFRTGKKEGRKAYQQNGQLSSFKDDTVYPGYRIAYGPNEEWPSLAAVIRSLEPVVVVDESHHAQTPLSIDMLRGFNPVFTLDLTATPRPDSNIISVVEAWKLKAEHMVKLPVIVSNQRGQGAVLDAAIKMQKLLEEKAAADEKESGVYIRPIVLLQAESRNKNDSTTYEKIKQKLIDGGIPSEQIAIKTAEVNELKVKGRDVDLMSRGCPIRYIITVNALKEGWDCPFAYVLATIANRSSVVDVEQIVGRILRLPHAREAKKKFLNMSYVFTNSGDFQSTLDKVVKGLNNAGFSKKEYRVAAGEEETTLVAGTDTQVMPNLFGTGEDTASQSDNVTKDNGSAGNAWQQTGTENDAMPSPAASQHLEEAGTDDPLSEFLNLNTAGQPFAANGQYPEVGRDVPEGMEEFFDSASRQQNEYDEQAAAAAAQNFDAPAELVDESDVVYVREPFREQMKTFRLPKFYYRVPASALFGDDTDNKELVTKEFLAKDFRLSQQNLEIDFENLKSEIYSFDLEQGDETPKRCKMSKTDADAFKAALKMIPPEKRKNQMKAKLTEQINDKYNTMSQQEIKTYIDRVVDAMDAERLADMEENFLAYSEKVAKKIEALLEGWYEKQFKKLLDAQEIFVDFTFAFADKAVVPGNKSEWKKMLYTGEGKMNGFEQSMIEEICGMENILWWHRNGDKHGDKNAWCVNGYLNHYPDFVVMTKKGHAVAIETKGEHLTNEENFAKARLGYLLDTHDNNDKFSYFMVFEKEKPDKPGCKSKQELLQLLEKW
ncbi:MAG: DEAD/DEAH box helicase family protein [Acidaminococcaceae bacterium]|nr:DEAD/DEAH box helicase family protein [Acidaminococcaceae bacterium]